MFQEKLKWKSSNGQNLFASLWYPKRKEKAVICLVHGFGEHCLRYESYVEKFIEAGFAVLAYDQIGHGQSEGKRGVIDSYDQLLDDVQICISKAQSRFSEVPVFLYGHSMGGNISFNYLLKRNHDLSGAIISSPWFTLTNNPGFLTKAAASFFKLLLPNVTMSSGLELDYISTQKAEVDKYKADGLNHGRISFRLVSNIMAHGLWAMANAYKLKTPTVILHGADDKITSPLASELVSKSNTEYIKYIEWPGCYHELHNDIVRDDLAKTIIDWINERIS